MIRLIMSSLLLLGISVGVVLYKRVNGVDNVEDLQAYRERRKTRQ